MVVKQKPAQPHTAKQTDKAYAICAIFMKLRQALLSPLA
jgi:hypothetical protein